MAQPRITRRSVLGSVGAATLSPALVAPVDSHAGLVADAFPDGAQPAGRPAFVVQLRIGSRQCTDGSGGGHWAPILGGEITGPQLRGQVQAGRVDWQVHPAGDSVELTTRASVLTHDGRLLELRDRGICPVSGSHEVCTSPQLLELSPDGLAAPQPLLVGRLDTNNQAAGALRLLAFEVSLK